MAYRRAVDVAVVGGGVVGLATAVSLQDAGATVVCIESGRPGGAQSAGLARLVQPALDGHLADVALPAIEAWERWEQRWSRRLLGREGVVVAGDTHAPTGESRDVPLDGEVFPLLADDAPPARAMLQERGSSVRAARAIDLMCGDLGDALASALVLGVAESTSGAQVVTNELVVDARHVVVCAGAATQPLAATHGVDIPQLRDLHVRLTFEVAPRARERAHAGTIPAWIDRRPESGIAVYGVPVGRTGSYALGIIGRDADVPLAPTQGFAATAEIAAMQVTNDALADYARRILPGLDPQPVFERHCIVTHLPWSTEHMGAWRSDGGNITFVAGNNMFMFAPLLGTELARMATTGSPPPAWLDPAVHAASAGA